MQYQALAPIYDRLMDHVNYNEWSTLIEKIVDKYSAVERPLVFELGAGTGKLGELLKQKGFNYTGSDLSFDMCRVAVEKRSLPLLCCDARNLAVKERFDLAVFLYDGINYLHSKHDYLTLFNQVNTILSPGGLFLFDITTATNSKRYFKEYTDFEDHGDFSFVRHSYFNSLSSVQYNDFTIFQNSTTDPQLFKKFTEQHKQKILPVTTVEKMIPATLFDILGIFDSYSFNRYNTRSERVHFLLRKRNLS